uniref:Flavin-containing monooxygenase n=1 Tax=Quercus lobata TaxID=97700 RepID=A0A7N2KRX2_QUELO
METKVLIVGAGPSGLATSACLTRHSIPHLVLEREDCYASLWKKRTYDRLGLHLAKEFCFLPHKPLPPDAPTFMPKDFFLKYVDDYVSQFNINPLYHRIVESASLVEAGKKWRIEAKNTLEGNVEVYHAEFLVVASGENNEGYIPDIKGLSSFPGEILHSNHYKSGSRYKSKDVLVVPEILNIEKNNVKFKNGTEKNFDAIVLATGYKSAANKWLKDCKYALNGDGMPKNRMPEHWRGEKGLYRAGLSRRGLFGVSMDAMAIANDIDKVITSKK